MITKTFDYIVTAACLSIFCWEREKMIYEKFDKDKCKEIYEKIRDDLYI